MLENKGSGSLNKDIEGDIGELMAEEEEEIEEFEDKELFDEFGDILMAGDDDKFVEDVT